MGGDDPAIALYHKALSRSSLHIAQARGSVQLAAGSIYFIIKSNSFH